MISTHRKLRRKDILTILSALSLFRLLLIPVIVWLYCVQKNCYWAVAVTALSGATDILDVKIARKYNMVSDFGKVLDPIADKLTQAAMIFCLISRYNWLWALIALFAVEECLIVFWGYMALKLTGSVNSAKWYGKLSAVVLYTVMVILFLFPQIHEKHAAVMIFICAAVMILSLVLYRRFYRKILTAVVLGERRERVLLLIWRILIAAIWLAIIIALIIHRKDFTASEISELAPSNPVLAALVMMMLFALKSVSMVLYCGILYAANGILFPLPIAIVLNITGTAVMVTIPYLIGKIAGAASVNKITGKYPKAAKLRELRKQNDFLFVLLTRLIGILPCDIVSLYMGAVNVDYLAYLPACILGMLRSAITFPIMGMSIDNIGSPIFITVLCIEVLFTICSVLIYRLYRKKRKKEYAQSDDVNNTVSKSE